MTTHWTVNFFIGIVPKIESRQMYPSALPAYLKEQFHFPVLVPQAAVASFCSMDEPMAVQLRLSPTSFRAPLFVWLPDIRPKQLLLLSGMEPAVENHTSADLRSNRTFLVWRPSDEQLEVRLDTWDLSKYLAGIESQLAVVFVGPGHAVAVRITYSPEEAEALLADLQAAASGSGPNWRPWRIYSDEEMAIAEDQTESLDSSVIVPRVATLAIGG